MAHLPPYPPPLFPPGFSAADVPGGQHLLRALPAPAPAVINTATPAPAVYSQNFNAPAVIDPATSAPAVYSQSAPAVEELVKVVQELRDTVEVLKAEVLALRLELQESTSGKSASPASRNAASLASPNTSQSSWQNLQHQ